MSASSSDGRDDRVGGSNRIATVRNRLPGRRTLRIAFVAFVVVLLLPIGIDFAAAGGGGKWSEEAITNRTFAQSSGVTVMTSDAFGGGRLLAINPDGSVRYYNDTYPYYHDVDPSPKGKYTITYVATDNLDADECHSEIRCRRSVVERLNLTTGEVERLWSDIRPRRGGSNAIHDVDVIDDRHILVAEIAEPDGVYLVNTTSGYIEWKWRPQANYSLASGGNYPDDWTHINDVEKLEDGRVMVSLRNQDKVIFLRPGKGVQESWTLGEDDNHDLLFEAHNPDYLNESQGGPAILVADSENNRVIEYQREDDEWNRTWLWQDAAMEWPRDADRLPNGNTLITDSNGDRVLEVNQQGAIIWSVSFPGPYEAERLGTGDESAGGTAAAELNPESRNYGTGTVEEKRQQEYSLAQRLVYGFLDLIPTQLVHGLLYVFPAWVTPKSAISIVGLLGIGLVWGGTEYHWSNYGFGVQSPIKLRK